MATPIYDDKWVIKIVSPNNPREERTHGHHSFNLYRDGMTYREYLSSAYDASLPIKYGKSHHTFTGPHARHFHWDIARGFIKMENKV
jgi:hypothetical protein